VHEEVRVGEVLRKQFGASDDDAGAETGQGPQPRSELLRQADAAVRGRMAEILTLMQGDAGQGNPLHEGHRRAAVEIGFVVALLVDDAEHAHRRRMPRYSGRDRRVSDMRSVAVEVELLLADRNDDLQRPGRNIAEGATGNLLHRR